MDNLDALAEQQGHSGQIDVASVRQMLGLRDQLVGRQTYIITEADLKS
jgi:hypothetical protein